MSEPNDTADAFEIGRAAWHAEVSITANPYEIGTPEHAAWFEGWASAEAENGKFGAGA